MKNKIYLILITLSLSFAACDEKQLNNERATIPPQPSKEGSIIPVTNRIKTPPKAYHYEFKNSKGQVSILDIKNDIYNFKNIKQEIVIINIHGNMVSSL